MQIDHSTVKILESVNFTEEQAEAIAQVVATSEKKTSEHIILATKQADKAFQSSKRNEEKLTDVATKEFMKSEIGILRSELKAEIAELRSELKAEVETIRTEISRSTNKMMFATFAMLMAFKLFDKFI